MNKIRVGAKGKRVEYRCSFCGKSQEQVHRLIAGPGGVYICDECVDLCQEIVGDDERGPRAERVSWPVRLPTCALCEKPIEETRRWGVYYQDVERGVDGLHFVSQFHEACLQRRLQPGPDLGGPVVPE